MQQETKKWNGSRDLSRVVRRSMQDQSSLPMHLTDFALKAQEVQNRKTWKVCVKCELDTKKYTKGIKVTDDEFKKVNIIRDDFHGEWNYSIHTTTS